VESVGWDRIDPSVDDEIAHDPKPEVKRAQRR
jgi:hypothetical protein